MTYALSLILWMATAQTATQPSRVSIRHPSNEERALRAQLDEARSQLDTAREQLAKLEAESGMPDNAVAALLLSDRPDLAPLQRKGSRHVSSERRQARIDVYSSVDGDQTMVAVVVNLKNPRGQKPWEPTEAWVSAPFGPRTFAGFGLRAPWYPPVPVAVRSSPQRILPGQPARIVVVFDKADFEVADGPFKIGLQRDGKAEFEFELLPSDLQPTSEAGG
jgi:hypothetical protein